MPPARPDQQRRDLVVQRVDDHLALDRTRDLDAAAFERGRKRGDLPAALSYRARRRQEVGPLAAVDLPGPFGSRRQQLTAARFEFAVQPGQELQRSRRQNRVEARLDQRLDDDGRSDTHDLPPLCNRSAKSTASLSERPIPSGWPSSRSIGAEERLTQKLR